MQAIQDRSDRQLEREILTYRERPYNRKDDLIKRRIKTFRTGDKFKIGSLEVEPIHVDHLYRVHTDSSFILPKAMSDTQGYQIAR